MRKSRVGPKDRDYAMNIVHIHTMRLQVQNWMREYGLKIEDFGPWNDKDGTIKHLYSKITFNQRMNQEEVRSLTRNLKSPSRNDLTPSK